MTQVGADSSKAGGSRIGVRLIAAVLLLLASLPALAVNCLDAPYFGVIDGNIHPPPSQIQIDGNCTIRNYPASNPLSTNFSFLTQPGQTQQRWLVIFDNVVHIGNMSCNATHEHKIWFVNGSSSRIRANCQNLLIPVEKIEKQNPAGQVTAAIGEPFTYRLIIPVLFDPATGSVIDFAGSPNDLHGITIWDDLNETGAELTYLSHEAYWLDSGDEVPHSFSNVGGLLTFEIFPIIPAEQQMVIEITVVLDESPANVIGTQFVNTAKWQFGRLIDDVFYEPLPGEWGVTPPMTIAGPDLVMTKTGPATMNLGELGEFVLDIRNIGNSDAWNRDDPGPAPGRARRRDVRVHARPAQRPGVRGRRRHPGARQGAAVAGH
jgi:large repetitive protein